MGAAKIQDVYVQVRTVRGQNQQYDEEMTGASILFYLPWPALALWHPIFCYIDSGGRPNQKRIWSMLNFFDDKSHHVTVILHLALVDSGIKCTLCKSV